MTYVVYAPPSARPVLATNAKGAAWRFARSLPSASILGVLEKTSRWVHFLAGRRRGGVVVNPPDVSALWRARAREVHGMVELPGLPWPRFAAGAHHALTLLERREQWPR